MIYATREEMHRDLIQSAVRACVGSREDGDQGYRTHGRQDFNKRIPRIAKVRPVKPRASGAMLTRLPPPPKPFKPPGRPGRPCVPVRDSFGNEYPSISEAGNTLKVSDVSIHQALRRGTCCAGRKWERIK